MVGLEHQMLSLLDVPLYHIGIVAAVNNPDVRGMVLMAGAGCRAGDILQEQLGAVLSAEFKESALRPRRTGSRTFVDSPAEELLGLFRTSVQPYMISWLALDPAAILAQLALPTLILQGERNLQAPVEDAKALAAAKPEAKLVLLPGVNHIFKEAPADSAANAATYGDPGIPIAPGVST